MFGVCCSSVGVLSFEAFHVNTLLVFPPQHLAEISECNDLKTLVVDDVHMRENE